MNETLNGLTAAAEPGNENTLGEVIGKKEISAAEQLLVKYKQGKSSLEKRIVEEEKWWRLRHWDTMSGSGQNSVKPVSAWLFNSIANKHADAMDNYPEPNVLPREQRDEADAQKLSSILPVILERCSFEKTYSDAWWYKLKHGTALYGVFWNNDQEGGLGDVDISYIDLLNVFWEPGVKDIQDSPNLFIVSLVSVEALKERYPELKETTGGTSISIEEYASDDSVDKSDKCVVVDWYYKKRTPENKTVLHYCKFSEGKVLFATENDDNFRDSGLYEHGKYPIVLDVLYPEEGTPVGFGLVAIMKDPQAYIDKLSELIIKNAACASTPRYFANKNGGINEEEFLDVSKPIVHVEGSLDEERLKKIEVGNTSTLAFEMLKFKIDELKETSSNRDVSQGSSSSGVTAAAAIAALQEAGNKTSRDMIQSAYRAYTGIVYLAIELIRQFYTEERCFRITGADGEVQYTTLSNETINPNYQTQDEGRRPIFDVVIKPQKRSTYSKLSQNELAKELYNMGFFHPQNADAALAAVDMMEFDGKQKTAAQIQRGQTLLNQVNELRSQVEKMGLIIEGLTGERTYEPPADKSGSVRERGTETLNTEKKNEGYAQRLANRAVPSAYGAEDL